MKGILVNVKESSYKVNSNTLSEHAIATDTV